MRLLRVGDPGQERPAVMAPNGTILDLTGHVDDIDGAFLAGDGMATVQRLLIAPDVRLPAVSKGTRIGPCIARPGTVVCAGLNYADHAREAGMPIPDEPILFMKATNTVVGPDDDVRIPPGASKVDWEVELAVVIGAECRYLADESAAAACIAGYAVSNDVSERAFQLERGGQWVKGKSCETFNPLGPWLVTTDEIPDPCSLALSLHLNGERMQHGSTATMVFSPTHLVWYISQFMVLEPGDVVNTGTPPGVGMGMDPPRYLRAGDVMELSIEGLGSQRQTCRAFDG